MTTNFQALCYGVPKKTFSLVLQASIGWLITQLCLIGFVSILTRDFWLYMKFFYCINTLLDCCPVVGPAFRRAIDSIISVNTNYIFPVNFLCKNIKTGLYHSFETCFTQVLFSHKKQFFYFPWINKVFKAKFLKNLILFKIGRNLKFNSKVRVL